MSKKVILTNIVTILAIVLSVIGVSCRTAGPIQFLTYTDEVNGFSIDYPQDWDIQHPKEPAEVKVAIFEKRWGTVATIIVAKERVAGLSLKTYSELRIQHLSDTAEDYAPISTEDLTINGTPAIKHTYTSTVHKTSYASVQVYLMQDETGWMLGFDCPQKYLDYYESILDTALNSFRLLK